MTSSSLSHRLPALHGPRLKMRNEKNWFRWVLSVSAAQTTIVPSFWQNLCQKRNKNNRAAATVQINATNMSSETTTNKKWWWLTLSSKVCLIPNAPNSPEAEEVALFVASCLQEVLYQYYTVDYAVYVPTNLPELPPPFRPTDHRIKSSQLDVYIIPLLL